VEKEEEKKEKDEVLEKDTLSKEEAGRGEARRVFFFLHHQ